MAELSFDLVELADVTHPAEIARGLLKQMHAVLIPVQIEEIASAVGIEDIRPIETTSLEGALIITGASGLILVNRNSTGYRQRFTIGHELGHFLCPWHAIKSKSFECTPAHLRAEAPKGDPRLRMEVEANMFSAEILLPEAPFKKHLRGARGMSLETILDLSSAFGVSKLATARRFVALCDDAATVVLALAGTVQSVYRGKTFPWVDVRPGQALPSHTRSVLAALKPGACSEQAPVEPSNWVSGSSLPAGATLFEQCLAQAQNFQMILLTLDVTGCRDDDEEYAEQKASWLPTFHREVRESTRSEM